VANQRVYRRVGEPDDNAVTVTIMGSSAGRSIGRVRGPVDEDGRSETFPERGTTFADDAIGRAIALGEERGVDVVVEIDDLGLWEEHWGSLVTVEE
jgi:hypothetical protein